MVLGSTVSAGAPWDARKCAAASGGRYGVDGKPEVSAAGYHTCAMSSLAPWSDDVASTRVGWTRCSRTVPTRWSPVGATRLVTGPLAPLTTRAEPAGAVA